MYDKGRKETLVPRELATPGGRGPYLQMCKCDLSNPHCCHSTIGPLRPTPHAEGAHTLFTLVSMPLCPSGCQLPWHQCLPTVHFLFLRLIDIHSDLSTVNNFLFFYGKLVCKTPHTSKKRPSNDTDTY